MNEFFDKEEWANRKQQDRESAYAMVDDALKKVGTDGKAFHLKSSRPLRTADSLNPSRCGPSR